MKKETQVSLDKLFSFFVFVTILLLAAYMATRISYGIMIFADSIISGDFSPQESGPNTLHRIAEVIVLIKAYRLLVSYLKTHHVSIEYIVEISIIASAIELIFAYDVHDLYTKIVFGVFGLANLAAYLLYFQPDHDEELHRTKKRAAG